MCVYIHHVYNGHAHTSPTAADSAKPYNPKTNARGWWENS